MCQGFGSLNFVEHKCCGGSTCVSTVAKTCAASILQLQTHTMFFIVFFQTTMPAAKLVMLFHSLKYALYKENFRIRACRETITLLPETRN